MYIHYLTYLYTLSYSLSAIFRLRLLQNDLNPYYHWAQVRNKRRNKVRNKRVTSKIMRESKVEKHLQNTWQATTGGECIKFPPLFYSGFPDRICLAFPALIVFVETKAPRKTPSLLQAKIHKRLRRWGFRVEVLDTIEAVDGFILTL